MLHKYCVLNLCGVFSVGNFTHISYAIHFANPALCRSTHLNISGLKCHQLVRIFWGSGVWRKVVNKEGICESRKGMFHKQFLWMSTKTCFILLGITCTDESCIVRPGMCKRRLNLINFALMLNSVSRPQKRNTATIYGF